MLQRFESEDVSFIGGETYEARPVTGEIDCAGCAAAHGQLDLCLNLPPCTSGIREDRRSIVWVVVE